MEQVQMRLLLPGHQAREEMSAGRVLRGFGQEWGKRVQPGHLGTRPVERKVGGTRVNFSLRCFVSILQFAIVKKK